MPRGRAVDPKRISAGSRFRLDAPVVKSAQRVMEIFQLFTELRSGVTVADAASLLDIPSSSTSALLRSLHLLGYLTLDSRDRTYRPAGRLALLGHWVDPLLVRAGPAVELARAVTQQTGFSSFLISRNNLQVQLVYREYAQASNTSAPIGSGSMLTNTPTGRVLISTLGEREVVKLVGAINASRADGDDRVSAPELLARLNDIRVRGYDVGPSLLSSSRSTIAFALPASGAEPMAFGVSLSAEASTGARLEHHIALVQTMIARRFGSG